MILLEQGHWRAKAMSKPTKKTKAGKAKRHGPLSLHPLSLDDALRVVLRVKPESPGSSSGSKKASGTAVRP